MSGLRLFEPQASTIAERVDALFVTLLVVSAIVMIGVWAVMIWFAVRYRRGSTADRSAPPDRHVVIELAWTLIPFAIFLGVFAWSIALFAEMQTPPKDAQTMYVLAQQWFWKIEHAGGVTELNELHVPIGTPVRLLMTSQDVIHSFYLPAFRVKQDVLPGRYTQLWFKATTPGEYPLDCAEYCGTNHAGMGGRVIVMAVTDYARWLAGHAGATSLAQRGAGLFRSLGCSGCHGENAQVHAPSLDDVYGRPVPLANGTTKLADENYLRDSILLPQKDIVAGYAPIMPSYVGQIGEEDVLALVAYIESLHRRPEPP
ncbi:MAG TPA: cytochrome c oxidase subunit II [Rudaea sp.]|nr:cytochrome c oxidase subunit II [Rudaea sp.]